MELNIKDADIVAKTLEAINNVMPEHITCGHIIVIASSLLSDVLRDQPPSIRKIVYKDIEDTIEKFIKWTDNNNKEN